MLNAVNPEVDNPYIRRIAMDDELNIPSWEKASGYDEDDFLHDKRTSSESREALFRSIFNNE
jgi:hypothetical protein